jgi:phage-related protein
LKPVIWVGSSREDLCEFPEPVQDHMGYALYVAQRGGKLGRKPGVFGDALPMLAHQLAEHELDSRRLRRVDHLVNVCFA